MPAAKKSYYSILIQESSDDQNNLFQISSKLMYTQTENKLPSHASLEELANRIADLCYDKNSKRRSDQ